MVQIGQSLKIVGAGLILVAGVTGCHKRPTLTPPPANEPSPAVIAQRPPAPPPPPPSTRPPVRPAAPVDDDASRFARMSVDALNATHPLGDVEFEFDRVELSSDARATLDVDASWLTKWPSTVLSIEGHADERGTAEYNLALGERRASVTRSYLESLGIAHARLSVVSKGEEAPMCTEHTEACWSQNRRAHLVITAK